MQKITLKKIRKEAQKSDEECTAKINHALDPNMDMTMDVYEVNDLKELWETDLEVSSFAIPHPSHRPLVCKWAVVNPFPSPTPAHSLCHAFA